ncbi:RES family NAD+ phosphorylase [Asticcacaulis sp.]|uniref:RES family NAD+ phosphorylase n=1 Tax=Asticcacaulis sp. TaxID=1872648 RepID=UPI0031E3F2D3
MSTEFDSTLTHKEVVERLKTVSINQIFYRLIPSRFPPVSLYQRIAPPSAWDQIVGVENLTNPRLKSREKLGVSMQCTDPASPRLQNWNHAPFTYPNPDGTTFFRSVTQCLELADCLQTALAYAIESRGRFLSHTLQEPLGLDMRVLVRRVTGKFVDGRELPTDLSKIDRWAIGDAVLDAGADGILFKTSCRPFGSFAGILNPDALGKANQADHFRFVWNGKAISEIYSFSDGKVWTPQQISSDESLLAA